MILPGRKVVLFPIETVVRELDFRLLLGAYCARPDTQIIIGKQSLLYDLVGRLQGGVFVGKNLAIWKSDSKYRRYKARGFRTIQLHEEGAIYEGSREDWAKCVNDFLNVEQFEAEDYVCSWGEFQAECYRRRNPPCREHIVVTGHPRFDLFKPEFRALYEDEVLRLKEKYGRFLLINTNFFWSNAKGMDFCFQWYEVKPDDQQKRTFYLDQCCNSVVKWSRFMQLINHLSDRFPELQIVVRPHPSESIHYYTNLLRYVPRVHVVREGALQAWLLATEAVIHDGCTTAIEAHLARTRVINFHPIVDDRFDIPLPNLVGVSCANEAEVEQALRRWLQDPNAVSAVTPENVARVKELIDNFGSNNSSFEKVARVVHKVLDEISPTKVTGAAPVLGRQRFKDALLRLLGPLDPQGWQIRLGKRDRGYQKFSPMKRAVVEERMRRIREITGRPVSVRYHSSQLLSMFLDS